jgi:hypothetical protein
MNKKEITKKKKQIRSLQEKMNSLGPVMRGTVVLIGTRNKQYYFSLNKDKKTKLIYLGNEREKIARTYSENYKKLLDIVEEMTILNMDLLKEKAWD